MKYFKNVEERNGGFTIGNFLECIVHYYNENDWHHCKLDIDWDSHHYYHHNCSLHCSVMYLECICTNSDNELDQVDMVDSLQIFPR